MAAGSHSVSRCWLCLERECISNLADSSALSASAAQLSCCACDPHFVTTPFDVASTLHKQNKADDGDIWTQVSSLHTGVALHLLQRGQQGLPLQLCALLCVDVCYLASQLSRCPCFCACGSLFRLWADGWPPAGYCMLFYCASTQCLLFHYRQSSLAVVL